MFFKKFKPKIPQRTVTKKVANFGGTRKIGFNLVVSRLARHVTFKISPGDGLEVVVPYRYNITNLPEVFKRKKEWIFKHLKKNLEQRNLQDSLPKLNREALANARQQAKKMIPLRTAQIAQTMNLTYNKITIRSQKTRWGSCSHHNNLNFNWRLILMPTEILDYVIIHELAHTVQHNHSKKFYEIVSRYCPHYKLLRKKLRHWQGVAA